VNILCNCFERLSLASLSSAGHDNFEHNISQGSVATSLKCGGKFSFIQLHQKFTAEPVGKRILKTD